MLAFPVGYGVAKARKLAEGAGMVGSLDVPGYGEVKYTELAGLALGTYYMLAKDEPPLALGFAAVALSS